MRVLVADDHSLFRDGIARLLEAAGHTVIGQVGDGRAAVQAALRLRPDVVLLDVAMPEMNGLEALRQIVAAAPDIRVVMLTVSDDDETLLKAVRAGARGYLLKNLTADEFLNLLNGLGQGNAAMTGETTARLLHELSHPAHPAVPAAAPLTPREIELLQQVAEGLSNKTIGQKMALSENTVKYHLKNILQKLGAQNRTEAVTTALKMGLIQNT